MYPYQKVETADDEEGPFPTPPPQPLRAQNWITRILTVTVVVLSLTLAWGWYRYQELCKRLPSHQAEPWKEIAAQRSPYCKTTQVDINKIS